MADSGKAVRVRPYADHSDDGMVQLSFTLPVPHSNRAAQIAITLAERIGLLSPEVVHIRRLDSTHTYFVVYAVCAQSVEIDSHIADCVDNMTAPTRQMVENVAATIGRRVVVVGASTGTDAHTVGIDAILNLKGCQGQSGLESFECFEVHNLGGQVPNEVLVARAQEVDADAILVSQTVTQQDLHIHNLSQLADLLDAEGMRERVVLACGGPRIDEGLAKELGFDIGWSRGTVPIDVAWALVSEVARRCG